PESAYSVPAPRAASRGRAHIVSTILQHAAHPAGFVRPPSCTIMQLSLRTAASRSEAKFRIRRDNNDEPRHPNGADDTSWRRYTRAPARRGGMAGRGQRFPDADAPPDRATRRRARGAAQLSLRQQGAARRRGDRTTRDAPDAHAVRGPRSGAAHRRLDRRVRAVGLLAAVRGARLQLRSG